jgi:D-glycero-alpha-D-manno-heptose-7-phosphate kinase
VLSATIDRWAYATLVPGGDAIVVESVDYDVSVSYPLDGEFAYDGQLDLAKAVIDHFRRDHEFPSGISVRLHNDAPPGSGLGSSSAIVVALVGALSRFLKLDLDPYAVSEVAYTIERVEAGIKGGRQDQYATSFGGFNFIEFEQGGAVVSPLRLRPETLYELEYGLVFAYVGGQHFSSHIIERQMDAFAQRGASAGHGWRSFRKRPTSSAAMCWASAADPPLPATSSCPPSARELAISSAALWMSSVSDATASMVSRCAASASPTATSVSCLVTRSMRAFPPVRT